MEITEVKINLTDEDVVKAYVSVVFDSCFVIKGIKIIDGQRIFVAMPSRQKRNGDYAEIAHPINNDMRVKLELAILEEYERQLTKDEEPL